MTRVLKHRIGRLTFVLAACVAAAATAPTAQAGHVVEAKPLEGVELVMPQMDPERGMTLFVEKGCVACHAINGVGGHDAPALDAHTMNGLMNPFDFSARMWNHAPAMIATQQAALGEQITLTGQELADIIAFVHDEKTQHAFTQADLTPKAREMMDHEHGGAAPSEAHAEELGHHHGEDDDHHE